MAIVNLQERVDLENPTPNQDEPIPAQLSPDQNRVDIGAPLTPSDKLGAIKDPVPDDHPTKLGRRVSKMEEQFTEMFTKFDTLITKLDNPQSATRQSLSTVEDDDDPDTPEYVKETARYLQKKAEKAEFARMTYETEYEKAVKKGDPEVDDELHSLVVGELLETNFRSYNRHSNDPVKDAGLNYNLALAKVFKKQRAGKLTAPNVHGDKRTAPTDVSSSTRVEAPLKKKIELDSFARKFVQAIGAKEDDEWVQDSIRGVSS